MKKLFSLCLYMLLSAVPLFAEEPALLRSKLEVEGTAWVGEKVSLVVELLAEGRFAGTPRFDLPGLSGVLVLKPDERPQLGTETIGETSYTVQRHEFAVFAQRAGPVNIPAFTVRLSAAAGFVGVEAKEYALKTSEHRFEAKMPPGAEGFSTIISTRNLTVEEAWEPEPGEIARVGDAFTRSVVFRAPDIPGMAFPPLPSMEVDGLGIYPKAPLVRDRAERGDFIGERVEQVTYLCERPGSFTLPALAVHWWDLESDTLKRVELPARKLMVEQGVIPDDLDSSAGAAPVYYWIGAVLLVLLLGGVAMLKYRAALKSNIQAWRGRREERESAYFRRLLKACRSGDPRAALNAFMRWVDRFDEGRTAPTLAGFLAGCSDPGLEREVQVLQQAVLRDERDWRGSLLAAALRRARKKSRRVPARVETNPLPALNPLASMKGN